MLICEGVKHCNHKRLHTQHNRHRKAKNGISDNILHQLKRIQKVIH